MLEQVDHLSVLSDQSTKKMVENYTKNIGKLEMVLDNCRLCKKLARRF